jgi:hypothetical protein
MKPTFTGTCLAAALGVALSASAQSPAPQTPPPATPPSPSASASLDREVKLTGCLKAGSEAGSFELANVKKDKGMGSGTASPSPGSTPAQPPASAQAPAQEAYAGAKNVKLSPAPGVDLAAHVNHQIEVAGAWSQAGGASPGAAGADAPKMGKTFTVTSAKMIAASCTTGTN